MGQTCSKDSATTTKHPLLHPRMKLFSSALSACASGRDSTRRKGGPPTKTIRPPPTRPTPVASSHVDHSPPSPPPPPTSVDTHEYDYDLSEAPAPLHQHQASYRILLSLLRRHRTVGSSLFTLITNEQEYLLHLVCELSGANASVIGLLVFAHPKASTLKSPRTLRTALQVALCHGAPMDVIALLFAFETDTLGFCQTPLDQDLLPLALLVQPLLEWETCHRLCALREDNERHAMFMQMARTWPAGLKFMDRCWSNYYYGWRYMDALGSKTEEGGEPLLYESFHTVCVQSCDNAAANEKGSRRRQQWTGSASCSTVSHLDHANHPDVGLAEGVLNLLAHLEE